MTRARDLANSADLSFDGSTFKIDTANDRVGIGTDSPSQNLHVSSTDHTRVLITGGTDKYAELHWENDAQKFGMGVQNDNKFFLYNSTGGSQVLTVDTSSNVGINTQSPGSRKLKIVGSTSAYPLALDSTDTDYALEFQRNGTSEWWLKASSTSFQIHENGSGDHVTVLSGGNVGIGTNSPNRQLVLYRNDSDQTQIQFQNQTTGTGSSDGFGVGLDTQEDGFLWNYEGGDIYFGRASDRFMTLKGSSGNVGIGTTSPDTKLHVAGTQNTPSGASKGMLLIRADGSTHGLQMGVTGSSPWGSWIQAQDNNISAPYPLILQPGGGKVGIGEDNPLVKLDMGLTSPNDQVIALRQNGVSRTTLGLTNNYGVRVAGPSDASATGAVFEVGQNNASDGTTYQNTALTVLYNGNVGIGTTSPVYELDVRGVFISPIGITSTHTGAHANQYPITNRTIINGRLNLSFSVYFQHNTSNLAVRLYCPVTSWWASGEVIIGSTYSYGNASGFRRYTFTHNQNSGTNYNHTLTNTENRGSTSSHFELNSHGWDATEGAHYWEFRHIASSGNNLYCQFQTFGSGSTVETVNWYYRHVTY